MLVGSDVEALTDERARAAGVVAGRAHIADVADARVVEGALRRRDIVVSSDEDDLKAIASAVGRRLEIERP